MKMSLLVWPMAALVVLVGCRVDSRLDYVNNARQLTLGTNVCAVAVAAGQVEPETVVIMGTTIHIGHGCSLQWYGYIKDPNAVPPPDIIDCATEAALQLVLYGNESDLIIAKAPRQKEVTDQQIELAKTGLDRAVQRFDSIMADLPANTHEKPE